MSFLSLTIALLWAGHLPWFTPSAAPAVNDVATSTNEDVAVNIGLVGSGSGTLTFAITTPPTHGVALLSRGRVAYTPTENFNGTDSFQFQMVDGSGASSNVGTATLTVTPVNDAPVTAPDSVSVDTAAAVAVTLPATDVDADALVCAIALGPAHGVIRVAGCTATYTSSPSFAGADSFSFTASDGVLTSAASVVSITVSTPNRAPTTSPITLTTTEDVAASTTLMGTDGDGDALTYAVTAAPVHGAVGVVGAVATYTPTPNYSGADTFRYTATDAHGSTSAPALVSVTVAAVNDAPVAADVPVSVNEDLPASVRLSASDPDARTPLLYAVVDPPLHGTLVPAGSSSFNFMPDPDFNGTDTFTYEVTDGVGTSNLATVTLTVNPTDDAPRVVGAGAATLVDRPVTLHADYADADDSRATPTLVTLPDRGSVSLVGESFEYTPQSGFFGADSFSYYVTDDSGLSSGVATVRVNVHPTPTPGRAEMPQFGLNKIQFGADAEVGAALSSGSPQYQPENIYIGLENLGAQTFRQLQRADLVWSQLEPGYGHYADGTALEVLSATEIEPIVTLFEIQYASPTPPWCSDPADFQKYMGRDAYDYLDHVIDYYGEFVRYYEIGNEVYHWIASFPPQSESGLESMPTCFPAEGYYPDEEAIFLEEAAHYIKAGVPDAIITLPAINPQDGVSDDWLRDVVAATADTEWFDVISYHTYVEWNRLYTMRPALKALTEDLGLDHKLIKMTEGGSSSDPAKTKKTDYPNSEETQASDIFRMPLISWGQGDASFIWHAYVPPPTNDGDEGGYSCEVLNADGTWRPSAYTTRLLTSNLIPFAQITDVSAPASGVYMYKVTRSDGGLRWIMWGSRKVRVPAEASEWTSVLPDPDGNHAWAHVAAGDALNLDDIPILLR